MKTAFLTETNYRGKWPKNFPNARTEIAWQIILNSDHFNIHDFEKVKEYDAVFIIFPKSTVKLNAVGVEMSTSGLDKDISIYSKPIIETLKKFNKKICYIQEGPSWFFNEYEMATQFNFYNQLAECDIIFAHNEYDTHFYKGLFPQTKVGVIPSHMIADRFNTQDLIKTEDKAIIGGNFCHWYGGFQSYITATEFDCPIYVPSSHCKRKGEEQVPNLHHLPWVNWKEWMFNLSKFKYAVNLMPTVAAGTFSMNCAYFGIPCIGNENVDTQNTLFPELSVNIDDIHQSRHLAILLKTNKEFYEHISHHARKTLFNSVYINQDLWIKHMENILEARINITTPIELNYKKITVVFTSCERFDLLSKTLNSFLIYNTYPIEKYIVIDNSTEKNAKSALIKIFEGLDCEIIINEENIGQVSSIDKAYSQISTEYIFHCEDDWEFFDYGFIEKSIDVLEHDLNLVNVNVRVRFDGERGSLHPTSNEMKTKNGIVYHEYIPNYLGAWHGFSWNPGLRRLQDYNLIKPYKNYKEESGVGSKYYSMNRRSACLEKYYCKHIGQNSTTAKRNE